MFGLDPAAFRLHRFVSASHNVLFGYMTLTNILPKRFFLLACALIGLLVSALTVFAHPHVFVEARSKLVFDDDGKAVAVNHVFRFDDAFTAFAIQGFDTNGDGIYSREELAELAKVNIESMADFGYFTFGDNTKVELDFGVPTDFWLEVAKVQLEDYWAMKPEDFEAIREDAQLNGGDPIESVDLLELHFVLPIKEPADALADRDRAGIGKRAVIKSGARDNITHQTNISGREVDRFQGRPHRIKIVFLHMRQDKILFMGRADFIQ